MGKVYSFDEAFTALCNTIESQARIEKSPICFGDQITRPFRSVSGPISPSLLPRLATLFERDGLLLRLDGAAVYLVTAVILQFPPSSVLSKTVYFFMHTLELYKDRERATIALRKLLDIADPHRELNLRCSFIFSPLLKRLGSILVDSTKHDEVRRMTAQFIVALCFDNPSAWEKLVKNQKKDELFTAIIRRAEDNSLRLLTCDIARHLRAENHDIRKIWNATDEIAMDFPDSQELGSYDMARLLQTIASIDKKERPFKEHTNIYVLKHSSCKEAAMQSSSSQHLLVLDETIKILAPDPRRENKVLMYHEFAIMEHLEVVDNMISRGLVELRWDTMGGLCYFEGKKRAVSSLNIEFLHTSEAGDFLRCLESAKKHIGTDMESPDRQLQHGLDASVAIDIPGVVSESDRPTTSSPEVNPKISRARPRVKQRQNRSGRPHAVPTKQNADCSTPDEHDTRTTATIQNRRLPEPAPYNRTLEPQKRPRPHIEPEATSDSEARSPEEGIHRGRKQKTALPDASNNTRKVLTTMEPMSAPMLAQSGVIDRPNPRDQPSPAANGRSRGLVQSRSGTCDVLATKIDRSTAKRSRKTSKPTEGHEHLQKEASKTSRSETRSGPGQSAIRRVARKEDDAAAQETLAATRARRSTNKRTNYAELTSSENSDESSEEETQRHDSAASVNHEEGEKHGVMSYRQKPRMKERAVKQHTISTLPPQHKTSQTAIVADISSVDHMPELEYYTTLGSMPEPARPLSSSSQLRQPTEDANAVMPQEVIASSEEEEEELERANAFEARTPSLPENSDSLRTCAAFHPRLMVTSTPVPSGLGTSDETPSKQHCSSSKKLEPDIVHQTNTCLDDPFVQTHSKTGIVHFNATSSAERQIQQDRSCIEAVADRQTISKSPRLQLPSASEAEKITGTADRPDHVGTEIAVTREQADARRMTARSDASNQLSAVYQNELDKNAAQGDSRLRVSRTCIKGFGTTAIAPSTSGISHDKGRCDKGSEDVPAQAAHLPAIPSADKNPTHSRPSITNSKRLSISTRTCSALQNSEIVSKHSHIQDLRSEPPYKDAGTMKGNTTFSSTPCTSRSARTANTTGTTDELNVAYTSNNHEEVAGLHMAEPSLFELHKQNPAVAAKEAQQRTDSRLQAKFSTTRPVTGNTTTARGPAKLVHSALGIHTEGPSESKDITSALLDVRRVQRTFIATLEPSVEVPTGTPQPFHHSMHISTSPAIKSRVRRTNTSGNDSDASDIGGVTLVDTATVGPGRRPTSHLKPRQAVETATCSSPTFALSDSEANKARSNKFASVAPGSEYQHRLQNTILALTKVCTFVHCSMVSNKLQDITTGIQEEEQQLRKLVQTYHTGSRELVGKFKHNATSRVEHDASKLRSELEGTQQRLEELSKALQSDSREVTHSVNPSNAVDGIDIYGDAVLDMLRSAKEVRAAS